MRRSSWFRFRPRRTLSPPGLLPRSNSFLFHKLLPPEATQAFAETVLWCSRQEQRTNCEDPEYLRNIELLKERKFKKVNFTLLRPLSEQFRSSALQPSIEIGDFRTEDERKCTVDELIAIRSQLLSVHGPLDQDRILSGKQGRLLVCWPAENVSDGASEVASLGFFDPNDIPPWDTWIHYAEGKLTCWVPESQITLAQNGIDANMVQCIEWETA